MGSGVHVEFAELSLLGHREENQDRAAVAAVPGAAFLVAIDGMGGHATVHWRPKPPGPRCWMPSMANRCP